MGRGTDPTAAELEACLEGGKPALPEVEPLVALAGELRQEGLNRPAPAPTAAARDALRRAVLAEAEARRRPGVFARLRGASLAVAAVAGGGLVVASAASGSNPVVLVADAARELPRLTGHWSAPPATVSIEGEVLASGSGGETLAIRVGEQTLTVEPPREPRAVVSQGTPVAAAAIEAGSTVRVTTGRAPGADVITAKKIEVIPTLAPSSAARPADDGQAPAQAPVSRPAPADTPGPDPTPAPRTPSPAVATAGANTAGLDPPATRTPTPSPTPVNTPTAAPTATPTKPPAIAPSADDTDNVTLDNETAAAKSSMTRY